MGLKEQHLATSQVARQVVGVDPGFDHSAPLDASGPFTVGQTVKVMTEVSNSAGSKTSAVRTIVIEVAI